MKSGNHSIVIIVVLLAALAGIASYLHDRDAETPMDVTGTLASAGGKNNNATLSAPAIQWVRQPSAGERGRLSMAFKVEASTPLRTLQVHIMPIVKMNGLNTEKDVRDVPAWLLTQKTINWDGEMDLTASPLAGQPVTVEIQAVDEDKREASSDVVSITLPERNFNQPLAKAIYNLRKALREEPEKRNDALRALATLLQQRDRFDGHELTLLTLRSAAVRIALDRSDDGLRSALDLLWHAAVLFEQDQVKVADKITLAPPPPDIAPELVVKPQ